jgi:hypothetical protein
MSDFLEGIERRADKRLAHSLQITLLDHKVNSENVSPSGVYFEVVTNNVEPFSIGRTVKFEMLAKDHTPVSLGRAIRLAGSGKIVRNNKIDNNQNNKKFGIALTFNEKLEVVLDKCSVIDLNLPH